MARTGFFKPVHVKSLSAYAVRSLIIARTWPGAVGASSVPASVCSKRPDAKPDPSPGSSSTPVRRSGGTGNLESWRKIAAGWDPALFHPSGGWEEAKRRHQARKASKRAWHHDCLYAIA